MNKQEQIRYTIEKYGSRNFAVYDKQNLICVTVYKKGAVEVQRRLTEKKNESSRDQEVQLRVFIPKSGETK